VFVPDERWDADDDVIVCKNAALHISSGELVKHQPKHYAASVVPYEYDPDARPAIWNYFLRNTVPAAANFRQEFAGYALTTEMAHELAIWLFVPPFPVASIPPSAWKENSHNYGYSILHSLGPNGPGSQH
jgi:phage/plasmid-associated DNA primase